MGKTTLSAAIGVRAAQLGRRVLVLTVDPAKRLATALELDLNQAEERTVPLASARGSLAAAVIDTKRVFDAFVLRHANQAEIVQRILNNRLYQQLSTTLSGSQEFTALERLLQAVESEKYDLVILDTPPTKHAMDFLTAPQRISSLFQDAVTKWFMVPGERASGLFASLISRGTRMALKSLEVLTGAAFIEELLDFFAAVKSIQKVLRERSEAVHRLLMSSRTSFVVVTSFDAAKLQEGRYLQGELTRLGYHFRAVIINRAFPLGVPENVASRANGPDAVVYEKVLNFHRRFRDFHAFRYNLYETFCRELSASVAVVRVPEYQRDVHGLSDLESLASVIGDESSRLDQRRNERMT